MLIELVFTNLPQQYSLPLSYKNTSVQVKWLSPTNSVTGAPPGTNLRLAIGYRLLGIQLLCNLLYSRPEAIHRLSTY